MGSIDIKDDSLPKVNEKEMVPYAYFDFIREKALDYLASIKLSLKSRKQGLPDEFFDCMMLEVEIAKNRVEGIRAFAIHKIQKLRVRETLLEQMFEEWLIFSVKNRNKVVYEYCSYLKEKVDSVDSNYLGKYWHQYELQPIRPDELQATTEFQAGSNEAKDVRA